MKIGERIRALRLDAGMTQEELAQRIGLKKQNISRYENSRVEPNIRTAKRIAEALGVSLEEMVVGVSVSDVSLSSPGLVFGDSNKGSDNMGNSIVTTRMQQRRVELGLTLDDIALEIGVARSTIQRYEKGTIEKLKLPVIEAIANVLQVDPAWLVGKSDCPSSVTASSSDVKIGERIKACRKELGVSAEYVAKKLGVSPATIYRYEKGDIEKMPANILEPISKILGTAPAHLMGWDDTTEVMNLATDKPRFSLTLDPDMLAKVLDYKERNHLSTQNKAVQQLIALGIQETQEGSGLDAFTLKPDEQSLVEDYRLLNKEDRDYIRQTMAMAKRSYVRKGDSVPDLEAAN